MPPYVIDETELALLCERTLQVVETATAAG
jgi:hypothetical protein